MYAIRSYYGRNCIIRRFKTMKQEIKNKLFTAYYKELQRSLVLNELFSVDVELVDGDTLYEIYSTILAESDEIKHYDPLLPTEYSKLCRITSYNVCYTKLLR